jgi:hypothetical protein
VRALRAAAPMAKVATDGGAAELLAARSDAVRVSGEREARSRMMAHPVRGTTLHCTHCVLAGAHSASMWSTGARAGRGRSARQIECSQRHKYRKRDQDSKCGLVLVVQAVLRAGAEATL